MLIVCPSCASRYEIDPEKLGAGGRKVRCRACSFQWLAHGEGAPQSEIPVIEGTVASSRTLEANTPEASPDISSTAAPAMRPDQSAEDFVAQEWTRAAEVDHAVSDALTQPDDPPLVTASESTAQPDDMAAVDRPVHPAIAALPKGKAAKTSRRKPRLSLNWRLPNIMSIGPARGLFSPGGVVVVGSVILALLVVQRHAAVARVPQLAGVFRAIGLPVNLQGLEFERVVTELVEDTQGRFLIVQGEIRNIAKGTLAVPPIEIVIQDNTVKSLYTWTVEASRPTIIQGDSIPFRTRLASPPQSGANVILRFAAERKTVQN
jgi:predicted Zn finger-like uncharacterized protein